jgi:hypothetical protein
MSEQKTTGTYPLYGMRASLYTGRVRRCLIKQDIDLPTFVHRV